MTRTRLAITLATMLGLPLVGTGCDSTTIDNIQFVTYEAGTGTPTDGGMIFIPGKPLLGQLIDRAGRPGINNMLTDPFGTNPPTQSINQVKDQYNAAVFANWNLYSPTPYIAQNLGIFDGLDGTCGNQFMAAGGAVTANRYKALADLLADDRLAVNTTVSTCMSYLAVERNVTTDCGGWNPVVNAMDLTYNLLIAGNPLGTYTNGSAADLDGAPTTTFPFLIAPK